MYIWLVRLGFINAEFEVTRLIGGSAEPEPDYQNWIPPEKPTEATPATPVAPQTASKKNGSPRKPRSRKSPR